MSPRVEAVSTALLLLLTESCLTSAGPDVHQLLDEYRLTKDWAVLRDGLEAALDERTLAHQQLQNLPRHLPQPLWWVGLNNYLELADVLSSGGRAANLTDRQGGSMMNGAAYGGHTALATMLLDRGAPVDAKAGRYQSTPMLMATWGNQLGMMRLLKGRGADVNAIEEGNCTSLHAAAFKRSPAMVRYLVDSGANIAATDWRGSTPIDVAGGPKEWAMLLATPVYSRTN